MNGFWDADVPKVCMAGGFQGRIFGDKARSFGAVAREAGMGIANSVPTQSER
jgi:hypothetical protein